MAKRRRLKKDTNKKGNVKMQDLVKPFFFLFVRRREKTGGKKRHPPSYCIQKLFVYCIVLALGFGIVWHLMF